ncbi:nucleic acid-binding protein [Rhizodiscina lignyota]|uniref:Nucleic acid-binding protein n=1 Tax=Rhizodiscina lignyota TaxID=1504668 RepID=A0A9P4IN58_9PEZI|nr:nucleic acid-binding protein [Rhizodiscina lignyota]
MPRPKRLDQATLTETLTPPAILDPSQTVARVEKAAGNNLYSVLLPSSLQTSQNYDVSILVEMPAKFRSTVWLKRGGYVLVELKQGKEGERDNKISGEIVNVVGDEKIWRKMAWWPKEFTKRVDDSDEEDARGMMPPSDGEDES